MNKGVVNLRNRAFQFIPIQGSDTVIEHPFFIIII